MIESVQILLFRHEIKSVLPKENVTQFQTGCVQSCKNQNGDEGDDWGAGRCEEEMCIGIPY